MTYVECKPDEAMVKILGVTRKQLKHENDKPRVCGRLSKHENCVGMVDEDPHTGQDKYIKKLVFAEERHGVRILKDKTRNNKVIMLCPRLEEWVIQTAMASGVKMSDFGLPEHGNELHRVINGRLQAFEKLLKELLKSNSDGILFLQKHLTAMD